MANITSHFPLEALSRRRLLRGTIAAGAGLGATACFPGSGGKIAPPPITGFGYIALSPDGRIAAVEFTDLSSHVIRIVLYGWMNKKIIRIPYLADMRLTSPCFSPDGRSLAAVRGRNGDIALIDLMNYEITSITVPNKTLNFERYDLRFSPDGRQIVYAESRISAPNGIVLHDIATQTSRELLDPVVRSYNATDLCFVARDEIIFQDRIPSDARLSKLLADQGHKYTDQMQYRLRFGDIPPPGFARPELLDPQFDTRRGKVGFFEVDSLSASQDGSVFAWRGFSPSDAVNSRGSAIFERRNGEVTMVAAHSGNIFACTISNDGSTIAFTEDPNNGNDYDLTIADRRTGITITTNLLSRLRSGEGI